MYNDERDLPVANVPEPQDERMDESCNGTKEWKPSNQEALREYEIRIKFLNRGCIVSVGCKDIAFEDDIEAMIAINAYVANPWEEQQKWRKILGN